MSSSASANAAVESRTYWCHECDMSISLLRCPSSPSPALCPHCHCDFLEQMDSSTDSDTFHLDSLDNSPATPPRAPFSAAIPTVPVTPSMLHADPLLLCAVCKDQFPLGAQAKQLPCAHLYHADCILPWLSLHNSCPLCRFCLPADDEIMDTAVGFGFRDTLRHIDTRHRQVFPVETVSSWPVHGRVTVSGGVGASDVEDDDDDYEQVEGDMGVDECVVIMDGDAVMSEVQVSAASASINEVINV